MKKLLSSLMIATVFASTAYTPKSEAGAILVAGGATTMIIGQGSVLTGIGAAPTLLGALPLTAGIFMVTLYPANPVWGTLGIVLIVLDENNSLHQSQIESALAEKYDFIADREIISSLATGIKTKADSMEADAQGAKMVSLSQEEVESILAPTDLTAEEIAQIVQDLK